MTDRSVPVGDRDEPPAVRPGPAMAREALASTRPVTTFIDEALARARGLGWHALGVEMATLSPSHPGHPQYLLVHDDGRLLAVWLTAGTIGYQADQWKARLARAGVQTAVWRPREGMGPVEAVLTRDVGEYGPRFCMRIGLDPGDLDVLAETGHFWLTFTSDHLHPFSVALPTEREA